MSIIIPVGEIASGKTEFVKYLQQQRSVQRIYLTQYLYDILAKRGNADPLREELQDLGDSLRKKWGPDILAQLSVEEAAQSDSEEIILDSIKTPGEISYVRKFFKHKAKVVVVAIHCSEDIRIERMLKRGNPSDLINAEALELQKRLIANSQRDSGANALDHQVSNSKSMELADYNIYNDSSLEEFYKCIDSLYSMIRQEQQVEVGNEFINDGGIELS